MAAHQEANDSEPDGSEGLRAFGAVLKVFRRRAGLSQEELAARVRYSKQTVSSVEQGRRLVPPDLVERAEEILDAFGTLRAVAQHAVRRPGLASWFRDWAVLEKEAISLDTYECRVVPGLLQTEAYARAVTMSVPPLPSPEEAEQRVTFRLERQQLLYRQQPVAFSFIIEQSVLERRTGGATVTRELIDHLLEVSELHNVELQLMPLQQVCHAGFDGPLCLLETQENAWIGYTEAQQTGNLLYGKKDISVLQQRYAKMRTQALTPEDTANLLKRMRGVL